MMDDRIRAKNMFYAYYKEYFEKEDELAGSAAEEKEEIFKNINNRLLEVVNNHFSSTDSICNKLEEFCTHTKVLYTTYPGLIIGSGYPHMMKKIKGEIQNGFLFDYVSGIPYIQGSSVKGVIEDVFERAVKKKEKEDEKDKACRQAYLEYIKDLFNDWAIKEKCTIDDDWVEHFWKCTFAGEESDDRFLAMNKRDIFFDAHIVGTIESSGRILGLDYITHHKVTETSEEEDEDFNLTHEVLPEEEDEDFDLTHEALFDPNVTTILKILPGVCFKFGMRLCKYEYKGHTIEADTKSDIFFKIIQDFGIGAKTNVGYGTLEEYKGEPIISTIPAKERNSDNSANDNGRRFGKNSPDKAQSNNDTTFSAIITGYNDKKTAAKFQIDGGNEKGSLFFKKIEGAAWGEIDKKLPIGSHVRVVNEGKDENGYTNWGFRGFVN